MIIEHCPDCNGEITDTTLTCYPPISQKQCNNCGKVWRNDSKILHKTFNPDENWELYRKKIEPEYNFDNMHG